MIAQKDQEKHNKEMMEEYQSLFVTELATVKTSTKEELAANTLLLERDFKEQLTTMKKEFNEQLSARQQNAQKKIYDLTQKLATAENEIAALKNQVWINQLDNRAAILLPGTEILPVIVKMSDFTQKKKQGIQWFSEPFFTQPNGYKMEMMVFPNGEFTASHMTVGLYLMKGPYDEQLKWPMEGEYEVELLNQISNSMHRSLTCSILLPNSCKPTSRRNAYAVWYSNLFISHDDLTAPTKCFLKDDNIYFQVCKLYC